MQINYQLIISAPRYPNEVRGSGSIINHKCEAKGACSQIAALCSWLEQSVSHPDLYRGNDNSSVFKCVIKNFTITNSELYSLYLFSLTKHNLLVII